MKTIAHLLCALAIPVAASQLSADEISGHTPQRGIPISSGYVIANGNYLPGPYRMSQDGDDLIVSGTVIAAAAAPQKQESNSAGPRGFRGNGPKAKWRRWQASRPSHLASYGLPSHSTEAAAEINWLALTEQNLADGALVVLANGREPRFIHGDLAFQVLSTLASSLDEEEKLERLLSWFQGKSEKQLWQPIAQRFQANDTLRLQLQGWADRRDLAVMASAVSLSGGYQAPTNSPPGWAQYGVTVLAMMLGVVGLGMLLSERPEQFFSWNTIDHSRRGISLVCKCVVLIVVLGLLDLGLTLFFSTSSGFVELNPLGQATMASPVAMTSMKVFSLLFGAAMLLLLRHYRGAQAAAWWMCMVTTLVTLRWCVFSSSMLS